MNEIFLHEFPGRQWTFEFSAVGLSSQASAAAVNALESFSDNFVNPLSADLTLSYFDAEFSFSVDEPRPQLPFWFLKSDDASAQVQCEPAWANPQIEFVQGIDDNTLLGWIFRAMKSEPASSGSDAVIGWRELLIRAARVRLPFSPNEFGAKALPIVYGTRVITYPIQRKGETLFVEGPLKGNAVTAPIEFRITNESQVLTFTVSVHWSLWTNREQPGWPDLNKAIERLEHLNWKCMHGA